MTEMSQQKEKKQIQSDIFLANSVAFCLKRQLNEINNSNFFAAGRRYGKTALNRHKSLPPSSSNPFKPKQ